MRLHQEARRLQSLLSTAVLGFSPSMAVESFIPAHVLAKAPAPDYLYLDAAKTKQVDGIRYNKLSAAATTYMAHIYVGSISDEVVTLCLAASHQPWITNCGTRLRGGCRIEEAHRWRCRVFTAASGESRGGRVPTVVCIPHRRTL